MGKLKEHTMEEVAKALNVLDEVMHQFSGTETAEEKTKTAAKKEAVPVKETDYESMSAIDLYKLCQKRGIDAEPRKKTSVYIALLKKADEAAAEATAEDSDDEDWEDEEDKKETKGAKKTAAKETAKRGRKTAKKEEPDEDDEDDDDWDL